MRNRTVYALIGWDAVAGRVRQIEYEFRAKRYGTSGHAFEPDSDAATISGANAGDDTGLLRKSRRQCRLQRRNRLKPQIRRMRQRRRRNRPRHWWFRREQRCR